MEVSAVRKNPPYFSLVGAHRMRPYPMEFIAAGAPPE
jgi:hypothetical protein